MHASQGYEAPSLGSNELPWACREFPSWTLPTYPRIVLADAWRACSDVQGVYFIRA
jgi:hypothetical protein